MQRFQYQVLICNICDYENVVSIDLAYEMPKINPKYLCTSCKCMLIDAENNPKILRKAARYLERQ